MPDHKNKNKALDKELSSVAGGVGQDKRGPLNLDGKKPIPAIVAPNQWKPISGARDLGKLEDSGDRRY